MKFELDTTEKTIKLLTDATLGEINEVLGKVLGDEAKQFKIITHVVNYNPVVISRPYEIRPWPYWWQNPGPVFTTECGVTSGTAFLCETSNVSNTITLTNLENN